jgi:hypothetical protein
MRKLIRSRTIRRIRSSRAFVLTLLLFMGVIVSRAADFSVGGLVGYKGGLGFRATGTVFDFAREFPLAIEIGIGYSIHDPGIATDVRRIFINEATNGTPEKSGYAWDFRFDFLYHTRMLGVERAYLYGGVRYSLFTGNFDYVGGNENFDITSNQVGIGLGLKTLFPMSNRVDFVLTAGLDYHFAAALKGHDTTYAPDNDNVNPREDFVYADADAAVNQPKLQPVLMLGVNVRL